jgi:acid-sensing ion channel, other
MCTGPVQGWKVKIHSPNEEPQMATGFSRVPLGKETTIVVKTEVTSYPSSSCHSSSSKKLKMFAQYSQENCMAECLSSFVLSRCGCVKFSMIRSAEIQICNQHQTKCVAQAIIDFYTVQRFKETFSCDCKPSCNEIKYNSHSYQADFNFKGTFNAFKEDLEGEFPSATMSRLVVYMEDDFYVPKDYSSESSFVSLIAKIGGVLAFFLGASWISIVEVVYYFVYGRKR